MITQEIIDKLKANEIPYGILKTKDWFTDEVADFMRDNVKYLLIYEPTGWKDKMTDYFLNRNTYKLKQDYILPNTKEVYVLKELCFNHINVPYIESSNGAAVYSFQKYIDFLGFYFGTKEEFNEYYKEHITKVDKHYSVLYQKQGKIVNGKLDLKVAKYVIVKGKDYE